MVYQKISALAVLLSFAAQSSFGAEALSLRLKYKEHAKCPHLEAFLMELRTVASDAALEIDLEGKEKFSAVEGQVSAVEFLLQCEAQAVVLNSTKAGRFRFAFDKRTKTFAAGDWLEFQRKILNAERVESLNAVEKMPEVQMTDLSPMNPVEALKKEETELSPELSVTSSSPFEPSKPFYKKWWFWGLVAAGIGTSVYLLTKSSGSKSGDEPSPTVHVE